MNENGDDRAVQTGPRMLGAGVPASYRPTQDTSHTLLCTKTRGAYERQKAAFHESKALLAQLQTAFQQVYWIIYEVTAFIAKKAVLISNCPYFQVPLL